MRRIAPLLLAATACSAPPSQGWQPWLEVGRVSRVTLLDEPPLLVAKSGESTVCWDIERREQQWSLAGDVVRRGDLWFVREKSGVRRIDPATGKSLWERPGEVRVLDARGIVLGDGSVLDAVTGELRWKLAEGAALTWTDVGLMAIRGSSLRMYGSRDGRLLWGRSIEGREATLPDDNAEGNRALVLAYHPECSARPGGGGLFSGHHDVGDTICIAYELVDLENGDVLWTGFTGGRDHFRGNHGESFPLNFGPHSGGPARWLGDRLAWFDLTTQELHLIDVRSGKATRTDRISSASSVSRVEAGVRVRVTPEYGRAGRDGLFAEGEWRWVDVDFLDDVIWIDARRALVVSDRLTMWIDGQQAWSVEFDRASVGLGYINQPDLDGETVIVAEYPGDRLVVTVRSLATGEELQRIDVPHSSGNYYVHLQGRYLAIPPDGGWVVYRR